MADVWSRQQWGARLPKQRVPLTPPQTMAVIHHTVSAWPANVDQAAATCRQIQAYHMDTLSWADIGYSWLIGAGTVFEGRGWGIAQAAQEGYNSTAISFAVIGDGTQREASPADIDAVAAAIRGGIALGQLPTDVPIVAHRDLNATACCGDFIVAQLDAIRQKVYGEPVTPTEQTVAAMYRLWCLREGDPGGIAYWAGLLDSGGIDKQSLALRMLVDEGWQAMVNRTGGPA